MEEAAKHKGTVTPISSLFSPEETQKASERVQETIADRRKQLEVLKGFISDNTDIINLVQTLPNELQHQIMVPFGKAAFFPGQLIHTNEFMVLLGDGYYAERTSKQTVEILKRRQKVLESQVESAKADIQDLKTEASFFDATADEAASGLVQIVEDYTEERPLHEASNSDVFPSSSGAEQERTGKEDDEYERIFARLAELEEEEAAENGDDSERSDDDFDHSVNELPRDEVVTPVEVNGSKQLSQFQDVTSQARAPASHKSSLSKSALHLPEIKQNVLAPAVPKHEASIASLQPSTGSNKASVPPLPPSTSSSKAFTGSLVEASVPSLQPSTGSSKASVSPLPPSTSSSKAFTGSIVEHVHNLDTKPRGETTADRSRPVSRFRMNRK